MRLSPRLFECLLKRHERRVHHEEFMQAQAIAAFVNFSFCRPKEPVKPIEFMPSEWLKRESVQQKPKRERMTKSKRKRVQKKLRAIFGHQPI